MLDQKFFLESFFDQFDDDLKIRKNKSNIFKPNISNEFFYLTNKVLLRIKLQKIGQSKLNHRGDTKVSKSSPIRAKPFLFRLTFSVDKKVFD